MIENLGGPGRCGFQGLASYLSYSVLFALSPEPGPPDKEDAGHRTQLPRACYLVLGPGMGWQVVALQLGPRQLLLLLSSQSPTHGLRALATHTLHALTPFL